MPKLLPIEEHPFQMPYNVTTFNQVLLAMCHPNRNRCIRGLGLRDAVVILDEFHKLPQVISPFFFRIAREYARLARCRFILGSATPLEPFGSGISRIPAGFRRRRPLRFTAPPKSTNRRLYRSMGFLTLQELGTEIETFQQESDPESAGCGQPDRGGELAVAAAFSTGVQPVAAVGGVENSRNRADHGLAGRVGAAAAATRSDHRLPRRDATPAVTLVSTQMIEVGVDLDFDAAFIDYQGLACDDAARRSGLAATAGKRRAKSACLRWSAPTEIPRSSS